MVGACFLQGLRFGIRHLHVADDRQIFSKWFEQLQATAGKIEVMACRGRRPQVPGGAVLRASRRAVYHFNADQAGAIRRRCVSQRLQERQRDRCTKAVQKRAPRDGWHYRYLAGAAFVAVQVIGPIALSA